MRTERPTSVDVHPLVAPSGQDGPMGKRNRERRRTKQLKRRREHQPSGRPTPRAAGHNRSSAALDEAVVDGAILALAHADCDPLVDRVEHEGLLGMLTSGFGLANGRRVVARRLSSLLGHGLTRSASQGWAPDEIARTVRRQAGAAAAATVVVPDPPFDKKGGAADSSGAACSLLDPDGATWAKDVRAAVRAFSVLEHLPPLPKAGPIGVSSGTSRTRIDHPALKRVRALLAKAESTGYPEEADACMAKAQELMTRHCIDRALAEAGTSDEPQVELRRIWLDDPYLEAKALLLAKVAAANRCRAVVTPDLGFSTMVGHGEDIEATELLFTSLLVQATKRITVLGHEHGQGSRARKPSYRRSFLVSYATRIGTRLQEATRSATLAADQALDHRLLPVLARREGHVDQAVEHIFGRLDQLEFSPTDLAGWAAGRAAADLADLAVHDTLPYVAAS